MSSTKPDRRWSWGPSSANPPSTSGSSWAGDYLCCSERVLSEIVVPIFDPAGAFAAELDIDSHTPAAFTDADRGFLEAVCGELSVLFG